MQTRPLQQIKIPWEKRYFDLIASVTLAVLFLPVAIVIFLAILAESLIRSESFWVLYVETRISQGRPFQFYKFRIFREQSIVQARRGRTSIQTKDLERDKQNLTYVGRFLRQIYMDELPQVINVFKGEMSLVGPRPTNEENFQRLLSEGKYSKYLLRAGITGYFQTHKGQVMNKDQNELDMIYADFCRNNPGWKVVLYDAVILVITGLTVIRAEGI